MIGSVIGGHAREVRRCASSSAKAWLDGAFGLSTGLLHSGSVHDDGRGHRSREGSGSMGGIHISHMREETAKVMTASRDHRDRRKGRPANTGHAPQNHRQGELGPKCRDAPVDWRGRARGVDATIDEYPNRIGDGDRIGARARLGSRRRTGTEAKRLKDAGSRADIVGVK